MAKVENMTQLVEKWYGQYNDFTQITPRLNFHANYNLIIFNFQLTKFIIDGQSNKFKIIWLK